MSSLIVEVVKIGPVEKHPNADTLSIAHVKGWQTIIKTGEFQEGDLAIYIPIDSVLPEKLIEEYDLNYLKKGRRVTTVKLRGYISQGLLLPVPEGSGWQEGQNVAKELDIEKYEPPEPSTEGFRGTPRQSTKLRRNPNFPRYTDIENIKNFPDVFKDRERVVITEKLHGTSARYANIRKYYKKDNWFWRFIRRLTGDYEFVVGSRNVQITRGTRHVIYYGTDVYSEMAKKYQLHKILPKNYVLFGEIVGYKIQDLTYGYNKPREMDIYFYDLMVNEKYVPYEDFVDFCRKHNLPTVPELYSGPFSQELLNMCTTGTSVLAQQRGVKQIREGCVIKPLEEKNDPKIGRKVLKSINDEYLLRKGGTEFH